MVVIMIPVIVVIVFSVRVVMMMVVDQVVCVGSPRMSA